VVKAAAEVGVRHIVYPGASEVEGMDFPLLSSHTRVYDAIVQSGVQGTHLRNNIYAEVVAGEVAGAIAAGELAAPVNGARVAPVLREDLAAATAAARPATRERTYDLTAHDTVGFDQLAELASQRAGKPISYRSIDDTEAAARMEVAGLPPAFIPSMLGFYAAYRADWSGTPSGHIEQLAGRPAASSLDAIAAVLDGKAR
jgi:NAD(P)H dehydrogenase (quinone)